MKFSTPIKLLFLSSLAVAVGGIFQAFEMNVSDPIYAAMLAFNVLAGL